MARVEVEVEGLKPCPFCVDPHPEIASGDSVVCTNSDGDCFASNSYDAWQRRPKFAHGDLLRAAEFFYQAATGNPEDMSHWGRHMASIIAAQQTERLS